MRLIDADALKAKFCNHCDERDCKPDATDTVYGCVIADTIDSMPTADVQPMKHGRWIKHRIDDPKSILYGAVKDTTCSVCGKSTPYNTEYCMHCGARMDGDSE